MSKSIRGLPSFGSASNSRARFVSFSCREPRMHSLQSGHAIQSHQTEDLGRGPVRITEAACAQVRRTSSCRELPRRLPKHKRAHRT